MPLYEYQCPKDGTFELVRKFSDPPLAACPTCGGPIEKLASAPAIQFKGSGWYITDYARKSTGGEAAGNKDAVKDAVKDAGKKDGGSKDKGSSDASKSASSSSSATESKPSSSGSGSDKK
ncbi:MAG TPA: zinc ribbon domain-containing protein [Vicinamibacteria bacterium]|nr:zinc ribbon domain-containing protein [Vicinamibacteria bacterium]